MCAFMFVVEMGLVFKWDMCPSLGPVRFKTRVERVI